MTEFFGFFTLAGEAASVLGPFLWAATLTLFPDKSPAGYRAGIAVLFVVLVFAIGAFLKVRFPRAEAAPAAREARRRRARPSPRRPLLPARSRSRASRTCRARGRSSSSRTTSTGSWTRWSSCTRCRVPSSSSRSPRSGRSRCCGSLLDLLGCVPVVRRGEEDRGISSKGEERNRGVVREARGGARGRRRDPDLPRGPVALRPPPFGDPDGRRPRPSPFKEIPGRPSPRPLVHEEGGTSGPTCS